MTKERLKPWHEVVGLKEEIRTGSLALEEFAADLHDVTLGLGRRPVYEDPEKFFALTYPTLALRDLVKDLASRLAGTSDKAVRQLELTYGGGKTHTLIALYYLFRNPDALPDLPAVREFREHVGGDFPRAHVVALCFDKIDVERGLEDVRAPDGETRRLLHPWSILAFQLAGAEGLRLLHPDNEDQERDTPPSEPLLVKLLERPQQLGRATLILVDEVLMYARLKAGMHSVWRERIQTFFQYLTQAVVKADRAAIVASILATDPARQQDDLGKSLVEDLGDVFRRQREEGVQPVQKEDVAEVLRRRFFAPETIRERDAYRSHVIGVVKCLAGFDEQVRKGRRTAEERFLNSFPFHPDLTEVFFSCWTQLQGFQRTRGILRILAIALREAEKWDRSPLIGPAALLAEPGKTTISESVRELAGIATSEKTEGGKTDWASLLEAELDRAGRIQEELPELQAHREAEQAVVAVFLHSQPTGHKAQTAELLRMIGSAAPDSIELDKGLKRWREVSWFLDDEDLGVEDSSDSPSLPKSWRLGNRANLRQMHDEACDKRISEDAVKTRLEEEIRNVKTHLVGGASTAGASVHLLPDSPRDVEDDGKFHYAVLGPAAVSESGKPSAIAARFIDDTGGRDRPRVHRNALVLAVPSRNGLVAANHGIRTLLGWHDVQAQLSTHVVDPVRRERLSRNIREARQTAASVVRQAYEIVVTAGRDGAVQAFKLSAGTQQLFIAIKNDSERARIQETPVDAEALLPDGPYDIWREGEDRRFVRDLAEAFARNPHLPKMLNPRIVLETVLQGVERGLLVARLSRPDGSFRTWWREEVGDDARKEPTLEVLLPGKAELASLPAGHLAADALPGLWTDAPERILSLKDLLAYFKGGRTVLDSSGNYPLPHTIPFCPQEVLWDAVRSAVETGTVWFKSELTSLWKEDLPQSVLSETAELRPRPALIEPQELVPKAVPDAWEDEKTNGRRLQSALSHQRQIALPWGLVRDSVKAAVDARWLDVDAGSGVSLHCSYDEISNLWLRLPKRESGRQVPQPRSRTATLRYSQIQDLNDLVPELQSRSAGSELCFLVKVELRGDQAEHAKDAVNELLKDVSPDLQIE